ncbi:hypothetical protein KR009_007388 [Drosophila setifemur]|nr:hypothetical protein KR009_007388 [Drosophila setifemur]
MIELNAKYVRLYIAVVTVITVLLLLFITPDLDIPSWEISVWNHVRVLQVVGAASLLVGTLLDNHWMFLPWLAASVIYIYTLLYKSIDYMFYPKANLLSLALLFCTIAGFWCYYLIDVLIDFLEMHYQQRLKTSIGDLK